MLSWKTEAFVLALVVATDLEGDALMDGKGLAEEIVEDVKVDGLIGDEKVHLLAGSLEVEEATLHSQVDFGVCGIRRVGGVDPVAVLEGRVELADAIPMVLVLLPDALAEFKLISHDCCGLSGLFVGVMSIGVGVLSKRCASMMTDD